MLVLFSTFHTRSALSVSAAQVLYGSARSALTPPQEPSVLRYPGPAVSGPGSSWPPSLLLLLLAGTCFLGPECPRSCSAPSFPRSFASGLLLRKGRVHGKACLRTCLFWPHVDLSCGWEQPSRVTATPWTCEAFRPGSLLPRCCGCVRGPWVPSFYRRGPSPALFESSRLSLALGCYIS